MMDSNGTRAAWKHGLAAGLGLLSLCTVAPSPAGAQDLLFHGQVRPRFEVRDLGGGSDATALTNMRVRADLLARLDRGVRVFIQLQDVRVWGEETSTLADFSADQLDLHQGYVAIAFGEGERVSATVGRQETNLGGQRLVGAVGWTPQGRSFDGVRLRTGSDRGSLDVLAYKLREGDLQGVEDAELVGAYAVLEADGRNDVDLYVLHNRNSLGPDTRQTTVGTRVHGALDRFTYRGEVSIQRGQRAGEDVAAFMWGARVGTAFRNGRSAVAIWYDYLSGDDDPEDGEVRVFDTLFGTNHKFYGFADLFLNIPLHTGGLGLQDAALKTRFDLNDAVRLNADLHHFSLAQRGAFGSSSLGQELDLTLDYRYTDRVGFTAGHSVVFADDALVDLGRALGTVHFAYVMLNARF